MHPDNIAKDCEQSLLFQVAGYDGLGWPHRCRHRHDLSCHRAPGIQAEEERQRAKKKTQIGRGHDRTGHTGPKRKIRQVQSCGDNTSFVTSSTPCSPEVRISAFHADGLGSIPSKEA